MRCDANINTINKSWMQFKYLTFSLLQFKLIDWQTIEVTNPPDNNDVEGGNLKFVLNAVWQSS